MLARQALLTGILAAMAPLISPANALAQSPSQLPTIAPNLARTEGVDTVSGIAYTRLYVSAADVPPSATLDLTRPTLTAQCTKRPNGKTFFELFVNFGGVTDIAFHPPWTPADGGLFPPRTPKVTMTMEFLGYTRVKPLKRQWERVLQPDGQYRYNPPGGGSSNLDDVSYFFRYLRALPTLRLSVQTQSASFLTTALMEQLHKEPLCTSAGL